MPLWTSFRSNEQADNPVIIIIRLKAFGLAPSLILPLDGMKAVTMITAILAISEGWNCMPMNVIQRAIDPLIRSIIS